MLVKEAEAIIHSLSEPSKMPGYGYGISNKACITGGILRNTPNSVCNVCYVDKGHYSFLPCQKAHNARLKAIYDPLWVEAMITVLKGKKVRYFRWHDSGDLQGVWHLENIVAVCNGVPDMMFWLPTKEVMILSDWLKAGGVIPPNLCVRLSASLIDSKPAPVNRFKGVVQTCTVHHLKPPHGDECKAYDNAGKCGDCRKCWDKTVENVSYRRH